MRRIYLFNAIVFLAAFLLFQIELILAKLYLPVFGGGYLVWGACVVFFQLVLLLGYFYAHAVIQKIGMRRYSLFHVLLLLLPLALTFPGRNLAAAPVDSGLPVVFLIFWQLALTIGLAFFVLSTTSVIIQGWLLDSSLPESKNPYVLFAVSNLGSFAALLSYPFLFEPFSDMNQQLSLWRIGYALLVILHLVAWRAVKVTRQEAGSDKSLNRGITAKEVSWLLFSAGGVMLFLSVTNILTYEVAPIPLLWVMPLGIYLLSFTLNFKKIPWCPAWIKEKFQVSAGLSIAFFFLASKRILPMLLAFTGHLVFLFILSMYCQYCIASRKPQKDEDLTFFYAIVSLGGFLGGVIVTWVIPLVSVSMVEYLVSLLSIALAMRIGEGGEQGKISDLRWALYGLGFFFAWPMVFKEYNFPGIVILFLTSVLIYAQFKNKPRAFWVNIAAIVVLASLLDLQWTMPRENTAKNLRFPIYNYRNYYGIYRVYFENGRIYLQNGSTWHTVQYADPTRQNEPIGYYHRKSPIGELLKSDAFAFKRVGIIGLGGGGLSAYFNARQSVDFYELDPDVYKIASKYFVFLINAKARQDFIFGDARILLREHPEKKYDILIIDAFSGDSVPVHLLTCEVISEYRSHLNPGGVIVFHVTNRYLHLARALFRNAESLSAYACRKVNDANLQEGLLSTEWMALTWDYPTFSKFVTGLKWSAARPKQLDRMLPWTDKYTNLLGVLKLNWLLEQVKLFQPFYW